jgi:hypothetical protein
VKKDKQVGKKAMFGTNKLCMKGIYLPTFQRSIILRANEGYKKFTQLYSLWREKLVVPNIAFFPTCLSFFTADRRSCF